MVSDPHSMSVMGKYVFLKGDFREQLLRDL